MMTVSKNQQGLKIKLQQCPNIGDAENVRRVIWTETTRDIKTGSVMMQKHYTGYFGFEVTNTPPIDTNILLMNPFGFYIRQISWSEDFSHV